MILLTDLLAATGGQLRGKASRDRYTGFAHDSRQISPGSIFVAMRTATGDGHAYIAEAIANSAELIVCQRPPDADCPYVLVPDSQTALRDYARWAIREFAPQVIAVSGSIGKTSIREFAHEIFAAQRLTFQSPENFNGLIGLPLALGGIGRQHAFAILEMASDGRGEMAALAKIAPPNVLVLSDFDETYIEVFGSLAAIAGEHRALVEALGPTGLLVYPDDDAIARGLADRHPGPKISYGLTSGQVRAANLRRGYESAQFDLAGIGSEARINLPFGGRGQVRCALAALATGLRMGLDRSLVLSTCERLRPPPGRLRRLGGRGRVELLDDSFSISPASLGNALELLRKAPGQRICVLSAFEHLGEHAAAAARAAADDLAKIDELILYGPQVSQIAGAARVAGLAEQQIHRALNVNQAERLLSGLAKAGDTVLIKGSAAARLEALTAKLLANPEDRPRDLCRQTPIWRNVVTVNPDGPVWIKIDLDAISTNTQLMADLVGPATGVIAVLKAEGYGHGALRVASAAITGGATGVAVARGSEASDLRRSGFAGNILVLGVTLPRQLRKTVLANCQLTVCDADQIAATAQTAAALGHRVSVHLKVDTGMGRIGCPPEDSLALARQILASGNLYLAGLYTHFGRASEPDLSNARTQLAVFESVREEFAAANINPGVCHCAATAATIRMPEARLDAVRIGIGLLGIAPAPGVDLPPGARPALSMYAQVVAVRRLAGGSLVGYGTSGQLRRDSVIATVGAGYGDGFRHGPRSWGPVLIAGRQAPIVGRVCMDMFMVDVTDIGEVRPGDEVLLIGDRAGGGPGAAEAATRSGTIPYEVMSGLLSRVPRV